MQNSIDTEIIRISRMPATKYPLDLELPWVEKYRPQYLKDVVGNKDTIESLERIAQQGNMPHMILSLIHI